MSEVLTIALALIGGVLLGIMFFGGLWWTIQSALSSKQPGLLFAGSLLVRTVLSLAGFYFISSGDWHRLVACVAGFVCARTVVSRIARVSSGTGNRMLEEGGR